VKWKAEYVPLRVIVTDYSIKGKSPKKGNEFVIFVLRKISSSPRSFSLVKAESHIGMEVFDSKKRLVRIVMSRPTVYPLNGEMEAVVFEHRKKKGLSFVPISLDENITITQGTDPFRKKDELHDMEPSTNPQYKTPIIEDSPITITTEPV